ncbi:MAG: DUF4292 domain-containing protein [Tannerella sp.]|nr:DUF4292 domain-containing protein [Tannerella sp.]
MKQANNILKMTVFLTLALALTTCKTSEKGLASGKMPNINTLSSRVKVDISSDEQTFSTKGQLKMLANEVIHISLQPFTGFEAGRIELTPDSITVINRINKQYAKDSYKTALNNKFNFSKVQSVLTKNIIDGNYENLTLIDGFSPSSAIPEATVNKKFTVKLTFLSPEINVPVKNDFVIPKGYEKISTNEIKKQLFGRL